MLTVVPPKHKFKEGTAPTLKTVGSKEVTVLHDLAPCAVCGRLKRGSWHET